MFNLVLSPKAFHIHNSNNPCNCGGKEPENLWIYGWDYFEHKPSWLITHSLTLLMQLQYHSITGMCAIISISVSWDFWGLFCFVFYNHLLVPSLAPPKNRSRKPKGAWSQTVKSRQDCCSWDVVTPLKTNKCFHCGWACFFSTGVLCFMLRCPRMQRQLPKRDLEGMQWVSKQKEVKTQARQS